MKEPDIAFWKRRSDSSFKRKVGTRGEPRHLFLIVCEGESTEKNYFDGFRLPVAHIKDVFGIGDNTESLVRKAMKIKKDAARCGIKYAQTWCVFDKDAFPAENFNNAIVLANREGILVAYSNAAFELWYLLHFDYIDTPIDRKRYIQLLSDRMGEKYEKNDPLMYEKLCSKQQNAIKNAKKLLAIHTPSSPAKNDPSTTVHLLVEELLKYITK